MEIKDIEKMEILRGSLVCAPCIFCGYQGARYWFKHSHSESCPWYEISGASEREDVVKRVPLISQLLGLKSDQCQRSIMKYKQCFDCLVEKDCKVVAKERELLGQPELLTDYPLYFRGYSLHISSEIKKHIFDDIVRDQRSLTASLKGAESEELIKEIERFFREYDSIAAQVLLENPVWKIIKKKAKCTSSS